MRGGRERAARSSISRLAIGINSASLCDDIGRGMEFVVAFEKVDDLEPKSPRQSRLERSWHMCTSDGVKYVELNLNRSISMEIACFLRIVMR